MACEDLQAQVNSLKGRIAAAQNQIDRGGSGAGSRESEMDALQDLQNELVVAEKDLANCLKNAAPADLLIQVRDMAGTTPCLTPSLRATVQGLLATQFQALFPGAYLDNDCVGDSANQAAAFGLWISPPATLTDTIKQQYHAQLATDIGRTTSEAIAFYVNATLFNALLSLFQTQVQQSLPSSTHLTAPLQLAFEAPDTMVTTIRGTDEAPTPDVSFTYTITEKFSGGPGLPNWDGVTSHLDTDTLGVDLAAVAALLLGALGLVFLPLGALFVTIPLAAFASYQAWEAHTGSGPKATGVGGAIAQLIMPPAIPIPGGQKIPIIYSERASHHVQNGVGVEVDDTGMYVGGFLLPPVAREPAVTLAGNTSVSVHIGGPDVSDTVRIVSAVDFLGTLTYAWTVNGKARGAGSSLTLDFNPSAGPFGAQTVAVTVTDQDGLTAHATLTITVSVTQPPGGGGSGNPRQPA